MKKVFLIFCLGLLLLTPSLTQAYTSGGLQGQIDEQLEAGAGEYGAKFPEPKSPQLFIMNIIKTMLAITGMIFLGLVFYGGITYLISGGEEEKNKKAMSTIKSSIIGLAIVLFSYSLAILIGNFLTGNVVG